MSIRKISEDSRLRSFLSSHFDRQAFIRNLIKEGQSSECLIDIESSILDINFEIKGYISKHTDGLMSGMQDFALLAERYSNLSLISQKLHRNVEYLRKEAFESYNTVKSRTLELERIHSTSISLRLLRQFLNALSQIEHQVKATKLSEASDNDEIDKIDLRLLANAAKPLLELETLITNPHLQEIEFISKSVPYIRDFGIDLRRKAQDALLNALKDKNQAVTATSLQIFFNLQSLPEVVLLAVDTNIKKALELSTNIINVDKISKLTSDKTGNVIGQQSKKASIESSNQTKVAVMEIAHSWASSIYELALQILVLQKVLSKKEDPISHKRFADVLAISIPSSTSNSNADKSRSTSANLYLFSNNLVTLFWERLAVSMHDVLITKLKQHTSASILLYPHLTKFGTEANESLERLVAKGNTGIVNSARHEFDSAASRVLFSSTGCSYDDLFTNMGFDSGHLTSSKETENSPSVASRQDGFEAFTFTSSLKPLKDSFLINVQSSLNAPIFQMFPELEGYTAAIPSKRDVQAFIKVAQTEISQSYIEGDIQLVKSVCKECSKSIELFLSKVEGMVYSGSEILSITTEKSLFVKNRFQDHNSQLVLLLSNLTESLDKLPNQIVKIVNDTSITSFDSSFTSVADYSSKYQISDTSTTKGESKVITLKSILSDVVSRCQKRINILLSEQLLLPTVDSLTLYVRSHLLGGLKEGSIKTGKQTESVSKDPSKTMQSLIHLLPNLCRCYLQNLATHPIVSSAMNEFIARIECLFVSISALSNPMNKQSIASILADSAALEQYLASIKNETKPSDCPIHREFKSFFRLLSEGVEEAGYSILKVPNKQQIVSLSYINQIRPSTVLSYFFSLAPTILPMPYELNSYDEQIFLDVLFRMPLSSKLVTEDKVESDDADSYLEPFPSSFRRLFPLEKGNFVSRGYLDSNKEWADFANEKKGWEVYQECLDTFVQRLSVNTDSKEKQILRKWYEFLLEIGDYYFNRN